MIQSVWKQNIELKYTYKNEHFAEVKTYRLTKEELEDYLSKPREVKYRRCSNEQKV
jgi:hypothetical protein